MSWLDKLAFIGEPYESVPRMQGYFGHIIRREARKRYETGELVKDPEMQLHAERILRLGYGPEDLERARKFFPPGSVEDYIGRAIRDAAKAAKERALEAPELLTKIRI